MPWSPRPDLARGGFSLLEVVIALAVAAVLATALVIPLGTQLQLARVQEARRQLDEARDALLGFAAVHARLPCPATIARRNVPRCPAAGPCLTAFSASGKSRSGGTRTPGR